MPAGQRTYREFAARFKCVCTPDSVQVDCNCKWCRTAAIPSTRVLLSVPRLYTGVGVQAHYALGVIHDGPMPHAPPVALSTPALLQPARMLLDRGFRFRLCEGGGGRTPACKRQSLPGGHSTRVVQAVDYAKCAAAHCKVCQALRAIISQAADALSAALEATNARITKLVATSL